MRLVLGPYELVSPAPAAALALTLGADDAGVITLPPSPLHAESPDDARRAAANAPRYLQLLESWRWTAPLWASGLLASTSDGFSPLEDIRAVCAQIATDPTLASIADVGGQRLFDDPDNYLDLLSRDLLRGGGDPAVTIPLHAGLERFAARRTLPIVRGASASLAGRLDRRAAPPIARFSAPLIVGAAPRATLFLRSELEAQLQSIRSTLTAIAAEPTAAAAHAPALRQGAADFADAFAQVHDDAVDAIEAAAEPARIAEVAISISVAPADASLRAAAHALRGATAAMGGRGGSGSAGVRPPHAPPSNALATAGVLIFTVRAAPWEAAQGR